MLEAGRQPVAARVAGVVRVDLDEIVARRKIVLRQTGHRVDLLRSALRRYELRREIRATAVELHRQRAFRRQRHLPPAGPLLRRIVDGILHRAIGLELARSALRLARLLGSVGIVRLVDGAHLDAGADHVLPRLHHGHVVGPRLKLLGFHLLPRFAFRDRLAPAALRVDRQGNLRLRIHRLGAGNQRSRRGQLISEGGDVLVALIGERRFLFLPEGALLRLLRDRELLWPGDWVPARVAGDDGEGAECKDGTKISLHGCPFRDAYSRPYFFGLFPTMAAARICGTYSSVSSGSFFNR